MKAKETQPDAVHKEVARIWDPEFLWFLGRAMVYQTFGLQFIPKYGCKRTLLDPEKSWLVPDHPSVPVLPLALPRLSLRLEKILGSYSSGYISKEHSG